MFMDLITQHSKDVNSSQMICRFNGIPIKIPARYFVDKGKDILKFVWNGTNPRMAKTVLAKES